LQLQPAVPDAQRIALGVSYDGSGFSGWQTQPGGIGVQDALETALATFLGQKTATICAGRTDAGVHANAQVVHVDTHAMRAENAWVRALNSHLPRSVSVHWARPVGQDFSARFSATAREYVYVLLDQPVRPAQLTHMVGWSLRPLNSDEMHTAAQQLLGSHDFSAFRAAQCQAASPVRTVEQLSVRRLGNLILITIRANAYLHHMVRNIVGSLVYVGLGRWRADQLAQVLESRDRSQAAPTFAAGGLYLSRVDYPPQFGLPTSAGPGPWWTGFNSSQS
jgi:tRNA pseudouridine38-40 synthase